MGGIDLRALRVAWTVFLFALLLSIIYFIRDTLMLFAAAIFVAYMLSPMVDVVERVIPRRRNIALTIVYVAFVGSLVLLGFELLPALASQAMSLVTGLPHLVTGGSLQHIPLPHFLEPVREQVISAVNKQAINLEASAVPLLQKTGARILTGLSSILPVILVPILAFFFLKDGRPIRDALLFTVKPGPGRQTIEAILSDVHNVLKSYIRALVLLAVVSFCAWAIFLSVMRYPYELLLAGLAGILEFIPVIGPVGALVIMSVVVLVTGSGGILWIIVFWGIFRLFQDYVVNPYLMSSGVELHPLLILFGVLTGDALAGVPGMFFSVPALAMLRVVYTNLKTAHERDKLTIPSSVTIRTTEPVVTRL